MPPLPSALATAHWDTALDALRALSDDERAELASGLSLESYTRKSKALPMGHRPKLPADHPLRQAPHGVALALTLLRARGELNEVEVLTVDRDSGDTRSWAYKHQGDLRALPQLAGLPKLRCLVASSILISDIRALVDLPAFSHLYLESPHGRRRDIQDTPVDLSPLSRLPGLEYVKVDPIRPVVGVSTLGGCTKLRVLDLGNARGLTELGWGAGAAALNNLQACYLKNAVDLTHLSELANTPRIIQVNLTHAHLLTDLSPVAGVMKNPRGSLLWQGKRYQGPALQALLDAHNLPPGTADSGGLRAVHAALSEGNTAALAEALASLNDAARGLLAAGLSLSSSGKLALTEWALPKQAPKRARLNAALVLLQSVGRLQAPRLVLPKDQWVDHRLLDAIEGLTELTLPNGQVLSGDALAAFQAVEAGIRSDLLSFDPDAVERGLEALAAITVTDAQEAALFARLPDMLGAKVPFRLRGVKLVGADLSGQTLTAALVSADLSGACLRGAVLRGVDLKLARLRDADLSGVRFEACTLRGAQLEGVTLDDAVMCGSTAWPEGVKGPTRLPVADLIAAHETLERLAGELDKALKSVDTASPNIQQLLASLPRLQLSWSSAAQLQKKVDGIALKAALSRLEGLVDADDKLQVIGQFDDETGYDIYRIKVGPVEFNSEGAYLWRKAEVNRLAADPDEFGLLLQMLGPQSEDYAHHWEDLSDTAQLREGVSEVCENCFDVDEPVGTSTDLETLFDVVEQTFRSAAPMREEEESLPLSWVLGRCG